MFFWKRKQRTPQQQQPEPRKILIPEDKILQVMQYAEDTQRTRVFGNKEYCVARYMLWSTILKCIPETKEGRWEFSAANALHPCVIEILDKEEEA